MVCILKEKYKAELEEYSRIFGGGLKGEDIAYTLLCLNNGYTLDKAPNGDVSLLFALLLEINGEDYDSAVRDKAEYYSKQYLDKVNWLENDNVAGLDKNGEPDAYYEPYVEGEYTVSNLLLSDENIETTFSEFLNRLGFDVETTELGRSIVDLSNKLIYLSTDTNAKDIANIMAYCGFYLQTDKNRKDIRQAFWGKRVNTEKDTKIIADIALAILEYDETQLYKEGDKKQGLINNVIKTVKNLVDKILLNAPSYKKAVDTVVKRLFDKSDDYYNTVIENGFELKNVTIEDIVSTELEPVYRILSSDKYKGCLGGSVSVRLFGTLYRKKEEDFHDLDFSVLRNDFSYGVQKIVIDTNIRPLSKEERKKELLERSNELFKTTDLYKDLKEYYSDVHVKNIIYDREEDGGGLSSKCVTIEVDGFPVDMFFVEKDVFKPHVINGIKVLHFSVAFTSKWISLKRDKDIRDILNFRSFSMLNKKEKTAKTKKYTFEYGQTYQEYKSKLDSHIKTRVTSKIANNPAMTDDEILDEENKAAIEFLSLELTSVMQETQLKLAEVFGLKKQKDGSWTTDDTSEVGKLRVEFVNSLGDHAGEYDMALHTIKIGMDQGDPTTFNHELAHFYIRKFWNSSLVQRALGLVSKTGMTDEEREEALIEAITEMTTENVFNSSLETRNGFFTFWEKFANLLYRVFNIKTETARKNILESLTKSFVINEQLNNVNSRNHVFTMYEGVVLQKKSNKSDTRTKTIYKARYKNVSHDVAIQNIMNFIQSRESSAKRNPSSSKEELHRLQNMVYKAKSTAERITEAIAANDASTELHEKAKYLIEFMQDAMDEMRQYINMLRSSEANGYRMAMFDIDPDSGAQVFNRNGAQSQVLSDHQLINMKTDVIDFFTDTFRAIGNVILDARLVQTFDSLDFAELQRVYDNSNIVRMSQELSTVFNKIVEKRSYENVDQLIDNETNLSDDEKFRLKISMRKWLTDAMDFGDISALEVWAGLGSLSKSPVIRALQYMIDKTAFVSDNIVKEKGDELQEKLRKARNSLPILQRAAYKILPINIQKVFLEKHNGLPTGNFIQRINQGHYDQNREDYSNKLLYGKGGIVEKMRKMRDPSGNLLFPRDPNTGEKFDLDFDKYGNPIFPDIPEAYDIEKLYLYKMEEFYAENADRPYMPIYYKTRLDMLSVPTLHALRRFDDKIGELKAMCTVAGYPHYDLLTASQQDELKHLEAQKYNLGEFYELDGTLKPEDSDEYKIAKELYEFHEEVRKHVQYTVDQEAFDEALNASANKASFIENNTKWIINPRHTEYYNSLIPSYEQRLGSDHPLIKKYKELRRKRDLLVSHIKKPGFEYPDISMLWDEDKVELKFPQFWKNLKILDQEIAVTKARLKRIAPKVNKDDAKEAKNMFKTPYVPVNPDDNVFDARTLSWFKKITNDIEHSSLSYDDKIILLNKLSIRGAGSNPLSIFTLWMPYKGIMRNGVKYGKDRTGEYPMFIQVPLSHFNKIDTQSSDPEWVNTQFKSENGRSYVPKESIYKNKTYEKYVENGTQEMQDLYNSLVDTMKESWAKIPFLRDYDYRLPQMRANTLAVLGRRRNIFKSIGNIFAYWFNITEMDIEYNDDFETVPDGRGGVRRREFVPVRFIKRLNSPEYITSDVVGSVTMFYKMATDFQVKSQYAPSFQMFLEQLKNSNEERSVKKVTHMINTQLYDREENVDLTKDQSSNSNWAKRGIKFLKNTRAATQLGLLAFNLTSGVVSFLDPFLSMVADVITGKYTNAWDNVKALSILAWNFPGAVASLGRVNAYNKVPAAMQRFMLQKGPMSTYRNTYMSQMRRFLSDGLSMKIFSVGDYTMNAITMVSTMLNYRLYDDGNTKKWYHKKEFINKAVQDGKTEQEAKQMYRKAHILWNAYEMRDGQFKPKEDEVGQTITPEIEFNVRQQVRARVSIYNGIVDENEKTLLQTNVWLRFLTMLRNFFITGMWERFKNLRDFQIPLYEGDQRDWMDREGNILIQNASTEEIRNARRMQNVYKGGYNFNTRLIEDGIFTGVNNVVANIIPYIRYMLFITNPTRWGASKKEMRKQKREEGFSNSRGRIVTISDQDLYDIDKVLTELGLLSLVLFGLVLMARHINDDDDPPFAMLSIYAILVRLIQERATWYNPSTFFDIITTITTSWSDLERKFKAVEYLWDILGITGHDPSDIVQRGVYKGHTRAFRDLMMLTSSLGTHNLLSSITEEGVASKVRFYESILPWWAKIVQPEKASKRKKSKKGGSYYQI